MATASSESRSRTPSATVSAGSSSRISSRTVSSTSVSAVKSKSRAHQLDQPRPQLGIERLDHGRRRRPRAGRRPAPARPVDQQLSTASAHALHELLAQRSVLVRAARRAAESTVNLFFVEHAVPRMNGKGLCRACTPAPGRWQMRRDNCDAMALAMSACSGAHTSTLCNHRTHRLKSFNGDADGSWPVVLVAVAATVAAHKRQRASSMPRQR